MDDTLGFFRTYLHHQFENQAGIPLSQYILNLKITVSQRLLQFTEKHYRYCYAFKLFILESLSAFPKNNW